jgi:hypothetical protein
MDVLLGLARQTRQVSKSFSSYFKLNVASLSVPDEVGSGGVEKRK